MPLGAGQALGVQRLYQPIIARLFIEQAIQRKDQHGRLLAKVEVDGSTSEERHLIRIHFKGNMSRTF
jgi:hypothetical protein